jgi:hypothetical protein
VLMGDRAGPDHSDLHEKDYSTMPGTGSPASPEAAFRRRVGNAAANGAAAGLRQYNEVSG